MGAAGPPLSSAPGRIITSPDTTQTKMKIPTATLIHLWTRRQVQGSLVPDISG